MMITASLSVVLFALLPFSFAFFGAEEETIRAAASGVLAVELEIHGDP